MVPWDIFLHILRKAMIDRWPGLSRRMSMRKSTSLLVPTVIVGLFAACSGGGTSSSPTTGGMTTDVGNTGSGGNGNPTGTTDTTASNTTSDPNGSGGLTAGSGGSGDTDREDPPPVDVDPNGTHIFKNVRTGASGGFIVDVIFHPTEPDLIYAKTDIGGVYKWHEPSHTWKQLFAFLPAPEWNWTGPESVALDASNPDLVYVAAGTYTNDWASTNGAVYKSIDRGETFTKLAELPFKMGANMPGRGMGERLAVDPNDGNILYFGAREEEGLWRSADAGVTWDEVTNFPDAGPYMEDPNASNDYDNHAVGIPWVIFDPATGSAGSATQTIYVGVAQNGSDLPNLYRSMDAGQTWEAIPGQPMSTLTGNIVTTTGGSTWDISALGDDGAVAAPTTGLLPKQGKLDSEGTLYVTYSNFAGPYRGGIGEVWKFVPTGGVWTQITPASAANDYLGFDGAWWGYGGLGVDMQNPGTLVVSGVNSWWPDGMMFRTTDGGATWSSIWTWGSYPTLNKSFDFNLTSAPWLGLLAPEATGADQPVKIGWMMEGLNIDPFDSDRMMYGTGATLYGIENLSEWDSGGMMTIESLSYGIEETSVLGLVSPPEGTAHLVSVVGDIAGWVHEDLDTPPATIHTVPDTGTHTSIDFAQDIPATMVKVGQGFAITRDGGTTWTAGAGTAPGSYGTVAVNTTGTNVVWAPNGGPVSYSQDAGASWMASMGIVDGAMVVSDRLNPNLFYSFAAGTFYVSTDGGLSFTATVATDLPTDAEIHAVPGQEGHVWLAGGLQLLGGSSQSDLDGLWVSIDSGATFEKIEGVESCATFGFGMAAPGATHPAIFASAIVAGKSGIYRSDDSGGTWVEISDPTHQYGTIQCITGDPRIYGRVYFGTNGMGIIYADPLQ